MRFLTTFALVSVAALAPINRAPAFAASHTPAVHAAFLVDLTASYAARKTAETLTVEVIRSLVPESTDPRGAANPTVFWSIVSLESFPTMLASGTDRDLEKLSDGSFFARLFADRKPLANCTDVETAFKVAVDAVGPSDICSTRLIYVLSDLKTETPSPTPKKPNGCKPASFAPPVGMPWDKLSGITVKTFFTPPAAIAAWTPVVPHGLDFTMYTGSGPEGRLPKPQPNPRCAPDTELPARLMRKGTIALLAVLLTLGLFIGGLVALARRQPKVATKPATGLRPVLKSAPRRKLRLP